MLDRILEATVGALALCILFVAVVSMVLFCELLWHAPIW